MLETHEVVAILINVAWLGFLFLLWWWDNLTHLK